MKKIILAVSLALALSAASAQSPKTIPGAVKESLSKQYPHSKKVIWSYIPDGYMASFETRNKKYYVVFSAEQNAIIETTQIDKIKSHKIRKRQKERYGELIFEKS